MRPEELEHRQQERLDALPPAARAELLHVLILSGPRPGRPDRSVLGLPGNSELRELLIDVEEDKAARAEAFGLLGEMERK